MKRKDFYKNRKLFEIDDIHVDKALVSKNESYGTKNSLKYFIGYNDDGAIRSICTRLPQIIGYVRQCVLSLLIKNRKNVHQNRGKS